MGRRRLWALTAVGALVAAGAGTTLALRLAGGDGGPPVSLQAGFIDESAGIQGRRPSSWKVSPLEGGVAIANPAKTTLVEISAAGPASQVTQIFTQSITSVEHVYPSARLLTTASGRRLDGLPARAAALSARNRAGVPIRALVTVAQGRARTYLLEVFISNGARPGEVLEAQAVIDSLHLTG